MFLSHSAGPALGALLLALGVLGPNLQNGQDGQDGAVATGKPSPNREEVEALLATVESRGLEESLGAQVVEVYRQALQSLDSSQDWARRREALDREARDAPELVAAIQAALLEEPAALAIPPNSTLSQLEQSTATALAQLEAANQNVSELEEEFARRSERRVELPGLLANAQSLLAETEGQLQLEPASDLAPELVEARRTRLLARKAALENEILSHEREIATLDVRRELLTARRNEAARRVRVREDHLRAWQDATDRLRLEEAERRRREADEKVVEVGDLHPALAERARLGAELAGERELLAGLLEALGEQRRAARERLRSLDDRFSDARRKLDAAGLTDAIGRLLRQERIQLLSQRSRPSSPPRRDEIARVQLRLIELESQRSRLIDGEGLIQEILEAASASESLDEAALSESVREILSAELDLIQDLLDDYQSYFGDLVALDTTERQVAMRSDEFRRFINEHVLWVRSSTPIWQSPAAGFASALAWILDPQRWGELGLALLQDLTSNPAAYAFGLLVLSTLFLTHRRVDRRLQGLGDRAARATEQSIAPTLAALALSLLGALSLPLVLAFLAWRLGDLPGGDEFAQGLSVGLYRGAGLLFLLTLVGRSARSGGLGENHFGWPAGTPQLVRRQVRRLAAVVVPLEVWVHLFAFHETMPWSEDLARLAFLVQTVAFGLFFHRVIHPKRGVLAVQPRSGRDWLSRFPGMWHLAGVAGPAALGVLASLGFFFTARELAFQFQLTTGFLFALILLQGVSLRWVLVVRRRLAIAQARERRAAEQAAAKEAGQDLPEIPVVDEVKDAAALTQEIRNLVRTVIGGAAIVGLWFIWIDVLPALGVFRDVELWTRSEQVSVPATDENGAARVETMDTLVPVSLADLLLAAAVLFALVVANRNLPALLEVALLRRLPLLPGERYAFTTLVRYAITIVGLVLAFDQLGIGWSKVQWLAAGISVGLGFGLQEIFANFVSGLTLLFERPIRVGDWVTVGDIEGSVTRIRIRATTIVDRDRKELVVPNREFVTGQLINWTLSDPVTRVIVPVGIAYGSDVELAEKTLLRIGAATQYSLEDPPPNVVFLGFGSSSLDFQLRVFVNGREILPRVQHDLHKRIDREFRELGIVIAFPQRDLHLKTAESPFVEALRKAAPEPPGAGA